MKQITIPVELRAVTVGQYMRGMATMGVPLQCVAALSDWDAYELRSVPKLAIDAAYEHALSLLNAPYHQLHKEFTLNGVRYEFIDHWDELTMAEYIDLETFGGDLTKHGHEFVNVCYRPRGQTKYDGAAGAEKFRRVPATILAGAVVFFCHIAERLETTLVHSLSEEVLNPKSQPTMGGITRFLSWPGRTLQKLMKSRSGQFGAG